MGKSYFTCKKKTKFKKIVFSTPQYSLAILPNELAIKIFDQVSQKDRLNCRLTCWTICMKINNCYLSSGEFRLDDKSYKEKLQQPLSFSPRNIIRVSTLNSETSLNCLRLNFEFVSELILTGNISQANFSRLLQCTTNNLKSLKLGCSVLGGTEDLISNKFLLATDSKDCNNEISCKSKLANACKNSKRNLHRLRILDLCLTFTYLPFSGNKGFCSNLIKNLNSFHHLYAPFLTSMEFSIMSNHFQEKYMFSITELFKSIPKCSYPTLRKLVIIGPCFHFRHRNDQEMIEELLKMNLQLNHFRLEYETKYDRWNVPNIILSFIKSQKCLETVQIVCNGIKLLSSNNYSNADANPVLPM